MISIQVIRTEVCELTEESIRLNRPFCLDHIPVWLLVVRRCPDSSSHPSTHLWSIGPCWSCLFNLWVQYTELWVHVVLWNDCRLHRWSRVFYPFVNPPFLFVELIENLIDLFEGTGLSSRSPVVCLAIGDMIHIIIVCLVAHLAISVILVRYWLGLRNWVVCEIVVGLNESLSVFLCLFSTLFLNSFKILLGELLLCLWNARTVTNRHVREEDVIVIRLL